MNFFNPSALELLNNALMSTGSSAETTAINIARVIVNRGENMINYF